MLPLSCAANKVIENSAVWMVGVFGVIVILESLLHVRIHFHTISGI